MKHLFANLSFILLITANTISNISLGETSSTTTQGLSEKEYINQSIHLVEEGDYDQAVILCNKGLQANPNSAVLYNILSIAYQKQYKYEEALAPINNGLKIAPNIPELYRTLAFAHDALKNWEEEKKALLKALELSPDDPGLKYQLNEVKANIENENRGKMILLFALLLFAVYFFSSQIGKKKIAPISQKLSITELIFLSSSISYLLYSLFYFFSSIIWSTNLKILPSEVLPTIRGFMEEHDGSESYVLFLLMFLNITLTIIFTNLVASIKSKQTRSILSLSLAGLSFLYFFKLGFNTPMGTGALKVTDLLLPLICVGLITGLFSLIYKYYSKVLVYVIALMLFPACFVATQPIYLFDYSFILAPALRMLHGFSLSEIYFQYDLFLSLIGSIWLKLNLNLNLFQIAGQASLFLLLIGIFVFSKRFFLNKNLSFLLVIALAIIRIYANKEEVTSLIQVTPLRLDLWLIILFFVFWKGAYHWTVGIAIGLLVLVHKNFGLIYLISYSIFCFTLFLIEVIELIRSQKFSFPSARKIISKHLLLNLKNILIVSGFILLSIVLFKGFMAESAIQYQKMGIGMIPISKISFYWYVPVLFSLVVALLFRYKKKLSSQYFNTALLIVFLALGNSMYFFGRSHENNLINISAILILTLFLLFDLLKFDSSVPSSDAKKTEKNSNAKPSLATAIRKKVINYLPVAFILIATYSYSGRIADRAGTQFKNLFKGQFFYPLPDIPKDIAAVKEITRNSPDVYFLNYQYDFYQCYYGGYTPLGYYNPCGAWPLKKELLAFLQDLLKKNYYLVCTDLPPIAELLPYLDYNSVMGKNGYAALSNKESKFMLSDEKKALLHTEIVDSINGYAIYRPPVQLKNETFSLELLVNPGAMQVANAQIFSNADKNCGVAILQNNLNHNEYFFVFGNGEKWIVSATFKLNSGEWNYLAITANNGLINIFNNGKIIATASIMKGSFVNSEGPVVIGNPVGQSSQFNGLIKEVKISEQAISEEEIQRNLASIKKSLN